MALLDLVEYLDPTGNVLAARVPPEGSGSALCARASWPSSREMVASSIC